MAAEPPPRDQDTSASGLPSNPATWRRRVCAVVWPIILSNLSVPLVGLVDTAVMGHLPDPAYIGAVALGNHGLWLAFITWMAARALPLAAWCPRLEQALPPAPGAG